MAPRSTYRNRFRLPLSLAMSVAIVPLIWLGGCGGGMDFCEEGSKECSTPSGGAAGSSGNGSGGTSGKGGTSSGGASGGSAQAGTTGAAGDGGTGGQAPLCDTTALADGCTLSDDGIFVAPTGDDANDGATRAAPVATIAKGVELAAAQAKPLYICNSNYDEAVALDSAANDLAIYGGFTCPDKDAPDPGWLYTEGSRAVVAPTTPGYALTIDGASGISISDLEFDAIDGAAPGESSIAAFVSLSEAIVLNRVKLVAGKGQDGDDGVLEGYQEGVADEWPNIGDLNGNNASGMTAGPSKACVCPTGTTGGAAGGGGDVTTPGNGSNGAPNWPGTGGEGGTYTGSCTEGIGKDGENGPLGSDGAGASEVASFSASGWSPTDGDSGHDGERGQGGGGGAGAMNGGGGGGACGGCGGRGGPGGQAGGSSIGILAFDSGVTLAGVEITTSDAGDGGNGVSGQAGQQNGVLAYGGDGGARVGSACDGGKGGKGGVGGAGGGAAGGVSVGVVYSGTEPGLEGGSIMVGMKGLKGTGPASNDGVDGESAATLMMP